MKESDLFKPVATLLKAQGYVVQGEIKNLDVFAVKEKLTIAVEMKLAINLKLIYQVVDRLKLVDLVYLAVPQKALKALKRQQRLLLALLRKLEVGLITVQDDRAIVVLEAKQFDSVKSHQQNKRKQQGLMKEFLQRLDHPQIRRGQRSKIDSLSSPSDENQRRNDDWKNVYHSRIKGLNESL